MKFVFDLDGTICFKGQPVSNKILTSLEYLVIKEHEVIFASARPIRDLLPVLHKRFHSFKMIGGNGSIVMDDGEIISVKQFSNEVLSTIFHLIEQYRITYLVDSDWDYAYTGSSDHPILQNIDREKRANNIPLEKLHPIIKILMLSANNLKKLEKELDKLNIVVHKHRHEGVLDISPAGVDKWSGLQKLGVKEGEFIAFGNDANDIPMFQHALHSVMIGDHAELASFAKEQIPMNEMTEISIIQLFKR